MNRRVYKGETEWMDTLKSSPLLPKEEGQVSSSESQRRKRRGEAADLRDDLKRKRRDNQTQMNGVVEHILHLERG